MNEAYLKFLQEGKTVTDMKVIQIIDQEIETAKRNLDRLRTQYDASENVPGEQVRAAMAITLVAKELDVLQNLRDKIVKHVMGVK